MPALLHNLLKGFALSGEYLGSHTVGQNCTSCCVCGVLLIVTLFLWSGKLFNKFTAAFTFPCPTRVSRNLIRFHKPTAPGNETFSNKDHRNIVVITIIISLVLDLINTVFIE